MVRRCGFVVFVFSFLVGHLSADETNLRLDLAECPERVQASIRRELHDLEIPEVELIENEEDQTYRVVYKIEDRWYETKVHEDGILVSKLLQKKLRQEAMQGGAELYWVEITLDGQPYDLCVSQDGKFLSKRRRELPKEVEQTNEQGIPDEIALPQRMPRPIEQVVSRESRGGEVTGVPLLADKNPRVPHTTFSFNWSSSTKEGTKFDIKIDRTPAVK
ncbi:hypothetical protein DTL21_04985 [Bremerella cremea]|uniref:PepSY domain-containing protein n=1 Tax=Blastopirellula marina TaxID=124 RepID=A0A2S8FYP1_9BACT|nr:MULTISPECIES: hypothetical protein [Pirellulaceae]PQO37305.1 hypothetical protein C5Y83_04985 [Blastopirellula marina]RCS49692.1 hypothetical protein DTL21_04985 [Bremerella cremea]